MDGPWLADTENLSAALADPLSIEQAVVDRAGSCLQFGQVVQAA